MSETRSRAKMLAAIGYTEQKDASALARFLAEPGVRELLGEVMVGRVPEFLVEAEWLFRDLMRAYERREVTPKTAVEFLQQRRAVGPALDVPFTSDEAPHSVEHALPPKQSSENALAPLQSQQNMLAVLSQGIVAAMKESQVFPERVPVEDTLIDRDEAARMLMCKVSAVTRHVTPVRPGCWSRLMVLEKLEEWRNQAREKQADKEAKKAAKKTG